MDENILKSLKIDQETMEANVKANMSKYVSLSMHSSLKPVHESVNSTDKIMSDLKIEERKLESNQKSCENTPLSLSSESNPYPHVDNYYSRFEQDRAILSRTDKVKSFDKQIAPDMAKGTCRLSLVENLHNVGFYEAADECVIKEDVS